MKYLTRMFLAAIILAATLPAGWARPCPECSTEVAESSRFCPACGKKFTTSKTCAECSAIAFAEARFCSGCGSRFPFALEDEERLVAEAAKSRKAYLETLRKLATLYKELGLPEKAVLAEEETGAVERSIRILAPAAAPGAHGASAGPALVLESIEAADALYTEAESLRKSPNLFRRKEYLRKALELYEKVILKYPVSDKVDDCAYRMGEIYGSPFFESYEKALRCYEKCVTWNPATDFDARYRAAEIADYRLSDASAAIRWYQLAAESDPVPDNRKAAESRLRKLQTKSKE